MNRPRLLLADDHRMFSDALTSVLEPRYEVVGTAKDGHALLEAAINLRPDVVVLDIAMPRLNGFDAARQIKSKLPGIKLIFLTMHEDPDLVGKAFRAGASGFLLKETEKSELFDALERVLKGGTYVSPSLAKGLTEISLRDPRNREDAAEPTPRQREVIQLLAEGLSMKEVAFEMKITRRTVACHKYGAMELLNLKSNSELVKYALKHKIISV